MHYEDSTDHLDEVRRCEQEDHDHDNVPPPATCEWRFVEDDGLPF